MSTVLNRRDGGVGVYIGRPSEWGNPFVVNRDGNRREVVSMFRRYAEARLRAEPGWLDPLIGQDLVCWCAPQECHGDVLIEMIEGFEA